MSPTHRFVFLADLHLSDHPHTANTHALHWALEETNRLAPDFLAIGGDVTSYGTAAAATLFLEALPQLQIPFFFTPGNAELRRPDALPILRHLATPDRRWTVQNDLLVLLPDTSTGTLPAAERAWMEETVAAQTAERRIILTHYPLDTLDPDSSAWLQQWIAHHRVELLVGGHRHVQRQRHIGACLEVVAPALDPNKAFGDLPGIALFESDGGGQWRQRFIPWSPAIELLPADLPAAVSPVGWSIQGDPVVAAQETLDFGLSCLEVRPKELDFSRPALDAVLKQLRDRDYLYLSYHLPSLKWDPDARRIAAVDAVEAHLDSALEMGADSLTVHVPQVPAAAMQTEDGAQPSDLYREYLDLYTRLFRPAAAGGVRLSIENVHNPLNTPLNAPGLLFATRIEQYLEWIEAVDRAMADLPNAAVGAHFDVGHARNNGGELDNLQPLCEWYARLGRRILGYHIHQVDIDPQTGRLTNHREITGLFTKRISYAGFLWAWSTRQISRAPLFVEVRDATARRNTAALLKSLFAKAESIAQAAQLPGRKSAA